VGNGSYDDDGGMAEGDVIEGRIGLRKEDTKKKMRKKTTMMKKKKR